MTQTPTLPAELVDWIRRNAPADMPARVLPTLAVFAKAADEQGRGARPRLSAVSKTLGITLRQVSRNLKDLKDAGLLVLDEDTEYPDVAALPVYERPKVYDLGGALRDALLRPDRVDTEPDRGVTEPNRGITPAVADAPPQVGPLDMEVHGVKPDQKIPYAAQYIAADNIVRALNDQGARLYAADGHRMVRLVAQGLRNGWDEDELVLFLDKGFRSIFDPTAYLLFLMENNPTPPWPVDAFYQREPVAPDRIVEWIDRVLVHFNTAQLMFKADQVVIARDLFNAALTQGMTGLDLMLLLEEPTTWPNPGDELLDRVRKVVPPRPRPPASADQPKRAPQPTADQTTRRLISDGIAGMQDVVFNEDQAHTLDHLIRVALLNGWTHQDLFTHAARPLDGLDYPAAELVERYRGLEARR